MRHNNETEIVRWETKDGRNVEVTISLNREIKDVDVSATVSGVSIGSGRPTRVSHPQIVAAIGKLGLTADKLETVQGAIDYVLSCDYMTAHNERINAEFEAELAAEKEYNAHRAKVLSALNM